MTKEQIYAVLENVRSWPQEDQEELADIAREIEARRKGVYVMDDEERAAVRFDFARDLCKLFLVLLRPGTYVL